MAADSSFFRSSTAFTTVHVPYCSAEGAVLYNLPLVNGFHDGLHAVLLSGWQRIAHSSARQRLSWFARRFNRRMAADCSFFHSSMAFTMVFAPYISTDGGRLLILPLVNGFTMVCTPYCYVDGSGLLIPLLTNGFHDGFRAVFLHGSQRIAHSSSRQQLS